MNPLILCWENEASEYERYVASCRVVWKRSARYACEGICAYDHGSRKPLHEFVRETRKKIWEEYAPSLRRYFERVLARWPEHAEQGDLDAAIEGVRERFMQHTSSRADAMEVGVLPCTARITLTIDR